MPAGSTEKHVYSLSSELSFASTTVASVAFLKRQTSLDPRIPLPSQLQVINLPGLASLKPSRNQGTAVSPYEILHSVVHFALAPYFDAYTSSQDVSHSNKTRSDPEAKGGVPGAKKRIAELEMSLLHLQQNVEIPMLHLPLHEVIQAALAEAESRRAKPSLEYLPVGARENSKVLNSLQNHVNGWIKSIQTITKMSREAECDTAAQEINFWLAMENALAGIEQQLISDGVQLTMEVLRHAKRYQATLSFSADTGLKEAMELVQKYNVLMHDFPLDDLLAATSLGMVEEALNAIFAHLNKKLRICPYPIRRSLALVEAISGDLNSQICRLLNGRTIMQLDYHEFTSTAGVVNSIWRAWHDNLKEFTNVARDVTRRRNEKFIPIKVFPRHIETQERLKYIGTFRNNHEQLQRTMLSVLGPAPSSSPALNGATKDSAVAFEEMGHVDAVKEVSQAYAAIKGFDVLDTSPAGTQLWVQAETQYNDRTSRVENSIIARLRDRLATASTANEMFRVFSKFNALLVRPKVRGAIGEYQTQLLNNVKKDIAGLHERYKQQYGNSGACLMFQLRDLPPVSGSIIWVRQIERQLDGYMGKVEAVLGEDWTLHADGEKLLSESNLFRKKLETRHIYESWVHDVQNRKLGITGRLFTIMRTRASGNMFELAVNFDDQVIALFKEVRNMSWLNFQVPHSITTISKEAQRVYSYAVSLIESARSYAQTTHQIAGMADVAPLLYGYQREVQTLIATGLRLRWESFVHSYELLMQQAGTGEASLLGRGESKHVEFIRNFAQAVAALQVKTTSLSSTTDNIRSKVVELRTCP